MSLQFQYSGLLTDGRVERGVLDAPNADTVVRILAERGVWATDIRARRVGVGSLARTRGMRAAPLALGLRILADFLEAGLPLARALAAFEELAPVEWKPNLSSIRESVRQGKSFAAALGAAPAGVSPLVVGVIQAGEAGSAFAEAVRRAAEMMEETAALHAAIRGALAYPIILATAGIASLGLLIGVVLPKFAAILADLGQAIPPTTRMVLDAAALCNAAWLPGFVALMLMVAAWRVWISRDAARVQWGTVLSSLPLIGSTRRAAATARACTALSALLSSGVPIASALAHSGRAAGDAAMAAKLQTARDAVLRGERLSRALADANAVTPTAVRLVRAGEESGRLAAMLSHAARLDREDALRRTRAAVRLLEPALIIGFGIVVAFVAAAMLQALYSVRPTA